MSARQDERVPNVSQTHHTLRTVVANLIVGHLQTKEYERFKTFFSVTEEGLHRSDTCVSPEL